MTHELPESQSPAASTHVQRQRVAVLAEQVDLVAGAHERRRQLGVVDVGTGPGEQVAVEDEDAHGADSRRKPPDPLLRFRRDVRARRIACAPRPSGREVLVAAEPGQVYRDHETGEELEVVGKVLPLPPSKSRLPWAVETLRFCNWCDQPAQKDLNDCPTCGRRMAALPRVTEE